jgi:thymidylate synthase
MRDYSAGAAFFPDMYSIIKADLRHAQRVEVGEWHAQDVSGSPAHVTRELEDVTIAFPVVPGEPPSELQRRAQPTLPWADEHFAERVSGRPLNPPPSHERWPYGDTTRHQTGQAFSHTYPERFWPKYTQGPEWANRGIRFEYGDLEDVLRLFERNPLTRQAYLPVWFPEDLAAANVKARVPCSLGYHFMVRNNFMTVRYFMRSCEFTRHLRDDIYMAARLLQWVCEETTWRDSYGPVEPARVILHITSLHLLEGDL